MSNDQLNFDHVRSLSRSDRLYFAYGSNLNADDYARDWRKPLRKLCLALAVDRSLVFDRWSDSRKSWVLSLNDRLGALTDGGLFKVENWDDLDEKEGAPKHYTRVCQPVLVENPRTGEFIELIAQTYVSTNPDGFHPPSESYLTICQEGRKDFRLSTRELELAAQGLPNGFDHQNHNIFTYGTLCRGECRERDMQEGPLDQVGMAEIFGASLFANSIEGYPCMSFSNDSERCQGIVGDLWSFQTSRWGDFTSLVDLFQRLDGIECDQRPTVRKLVDIAQHELRSGRTVHDGSLASKCHLESEMASSLFRRTLVNVNFGGRQRLAWTYLYTGDKAGLLPIVSGNWRQYAGRWDGFLHKLAQSYIETAGGLEAFRARAAEKWNSADLADVTDPADLARRLDSGQVLERDLIQMLGHSKPVE